MNGNLESALSTAGNDVRRAIDHTGVKASKDKLMLDLKAVVSDAQALLKEAADTSVGSIAGVPAYLEDRLCAVKDNFSRVKGTIESKAKSATAATDTYVRENPWKSLGFATAASVILSCLLISACVSGTSKNAKDE
jgi:ElaB/YqjD/DUF883 family membrane-anchored ribosome-binding protein